MAMIDEALSYVAQGFKIFPVKLDKTPLTAHGLKDCTMIQPGVKEYWTKWPDAGIGLVTDGLIVLDFDKKSGGVKAKATIEAKYGKMPVTRTHRTGGGGLHYIYYNTNNSDIRNSVCLGGYQGLDLRANGGYIVVPPSPHESGRCYEVIDNSPIAPVPDWVVSLAKEKPPAKVLTGVIGEGAPIPEGQRNATLTSLAGTMRKRGMTADEIEAALLVTNQKRCQPSPLPDSEIRTIAKSVSRYEPAPPTPNTGRKELSASTVNQWITLASGAFNIRQMCSELNITSLENKNNLRVILHRLSESGVIAKTTIDGTYRKIDNEKKVTDWQAADPNKVLNLKLPFDIHSLCKIFPKSIIIVAGSKNEGKTAFLLSCIMPNTNVGFYVDFYNNETGPEQLKMRFEPLNIPYPAPFNVYERYDNFADVIDPDHISIIDYLDLNSEVYLVGAEIDAIFRKLNTGCAIIGLQKPPPSVSMFRGKKQFIDRDLAYGGGFTAKRAAIYISLSSHKLKLLYVKTPANPRVNPNNMIWSYDFDDNGYFTNIQRFLPEHQEEEM